MSTLEHFFKPTSDAGSNSSAAVPVFAFLAAQRETEKVASAGKKPGSYATISEELKAKVAKYAAKNGVGASLGRFKSAQELDLKKSTVRGWVTTYQKRLDSLRKEGKPLTVSVLSEKSRGRPLPIGSELEEQVKLFVGQLRNSVALVNSAIVRAAAKGIILIKDANLLEENGGGINLTKESQPQQKSPLYYVYPCCKAMFVPPLLSISLDIRDLRARSLQNPTMPPFSFTSN